MQENSNQHKPLRSTADKVKDLYNTYLKDSPKKEMAHQKENSEQETAEQNSAKNEHSQNTESNQNTTELQEKISALEKERDELRDQLLRKAAELENIRRRALKEKQELIDFANERLLFKMLPVLDDLQMAIAHAQKSNDHAALLKGIEMIAAKVQKTFEEAGVKPMDTTGKQFDVNYHDALMQSPSEAPEGQIIQEVQKGYMLHDKVLRHAKVITSAGQE